MFEPDEDEPEDELPEIPPKDEAEKAARTALKKGQKALELLREAFCALGAEKDAALEALFRELNQRLEELGPPEPRKCKEYRRALVILQKGGIGIHPDDVVRFCRCEECENLRDKMGLTHPPPIKGAVL